MINKILIINLSILILFNCSQQNIRQDDGAYLPPADKQSMLDANLLLDQAETARPKQQNRLLIQAAFILIKLKNIDQAEEVLSRIEVGELKEELAVIYNTQKAEVLLIQQNPQEAIDLLNAYPYIATLSLYIHILYI